MMGSLFKFGDSDGEIKWGELSVAYSPNNPIYRKKGIPVVIDQGYAGAREIRYLKPDDIIEER